MTIGHVAKAAGIAASTIRYYEAQGIIPRAARVNGVRQYGPETVEELKALRLYRATGIPIRGLKAIGTQTRGTTARFDVWTNVMQARIDDLDAHIREAQTLKQLLEEVIACRCNGTRSRCTVLRAADTLCAGDSGDEVTAISRGAGTSRKSTTGKPTPIAAGRGR